MTTCQVEVVEVTVVVDAAVAAVMVDAVAEEVMDTRVIPVPRRKDFVQTWVSILLTMEKEVQQTS